ncbi:MAG: inorganic phosphate transporter [Myxococcota bacterium]
MTSLTLLILVVIVALAFDFVNGFHDTANAIATVVSTGAMRARNAIILASVCNVIGAFMGTAVAKTLGKDILDPALISQSVVLCALLGAIAWNLLTWYFGIPSSSSHALVGGMVGAGMVAVGPSAIKAEGVEKVVTALIVSPLFGFSVAFLLMVFWMWTIRRTRPRVSNRVFRLLQLPSAAFLALSHGLNDAQKTMGVITMALMSYHGTYDAHAEFPVPDWVVFACAIAMGLGTAVGGWRIIHTMGNKIFKLEPVHGFTSSIAAALVIQGASFYGLPISTTHCITTSIMGAGATKRLSAVRWGVTRKIVGAWILTIPCAAAVSAVCYLVLGPLL